ncbi:MAG: TIGR01212 family radical SAM protein [Clostridiales bacterium]|nr:TIGR01212 family radical SAM protein [Clostridiales bacterium]
MTAPRYRALSPYLTERFGCKVYKLSLDGGMTCPNRDGTLGTRGCIFCSGAGEFAAPVCGSVTQQLEAAKAQIRRKAPHARYIAYFQSFTNTYASVGRLEALFSEALAHPETVALSVATRPDCLGNDVLGLLARLRRSKPVWVELGLQTIHPRTAAYIRRGYDLPVYDRAVRALHAIGVEVVTHMILGLPGETQEMAAQTAAYIGQSGAEGVKLHLLHVLRGTDLAAEYAAGRVPVLSMEEYLAALAACLRRLPPEVVIHRMTGDGAKRDLIAPLWSADKKRVLNAIAAYLEANDIVQGQDL